MLGRRDQEHGRQDGIVVGGAVGARQGLQEQIFGAGSWGDLQRSGVCEPRSATAVGIEGRGESGSFLSLSPGPGSPAAEQGARSPPGRAPRWRPGGAGGSGAGRGGAEESGGTETGPGGQGTALGRYPAGSGGPGSAAAPHPGSSAPPVPAGGSAAPGGSGITGRLRCPVAAAHPGGSGVSAPGRGEGGSGRSQASGRGRPGPSSAPRVP